MMISCQQSVKNPRAPKASGKRIKRGLYQIQSGLLVNADINGAANILKKVATTLGFSLKGVGSGTLIMPLRVQFWTAQLPRVFSAGSIKSSSSTEKTEGDNLFLTGL